MRRGGSYLRIADPRWDDPLDGFAAAVRGGRWNPPRSFPVVYLSASIDVARANVRRRLAGRPYGPEDLDPAAAPVLVTADVPEDDHVDVVTEAGCVAAGVPGTYPRDDGDEVGWETCQPIGAAAWEAGAPGISCRSTAAPQAGEELAWFQRDTRLLPHEVRPFDDWFWPP